MFKKIILIILIICTYIYLVTSDPKGKFLSNIKNMFTSFSTKYKEMNIHYHINKWPSKDDDEDY